MLFSLFCLLTVVPALSPASGAEIADTLRAVVGPAPVALLESTSFFLQDKLNLLRSQIDGGQTQIGWSGQTPGPAVATQPIPIPAANPTAVAPNAPAPANPAKAQNPTSPSDAVVSDAPQIGWQAYGPSDQGSALMARTMLMLDPQRSYTGVALVRMDLARLQLHMMPGTIEPAHPSQIGQAILDLGMIPPADQSQLIAAFNGGFKGIHGRYGMMVDGVTLLAPKDGLATVAVYQDGHIRIGAWGTDIQPTPDLIAFRQNCPPLIEAGQVNPALYYNNRADWGFTGNSDITWRTGLGITQDGRYLIYAVGNGTSAATLAEALKTAGAAYAMQLDINQYYAHFDTYQPVSVPSGSQGFALAGSRLLEEMINNPHLYLTPNIRDFFYMTLR